MADPLLPTVADFPSIIEKVGWTVATIIGLVYVLKWLSHAYLSALNTRISALEKAHAEAMVEIKRLNELLLSRADEHAEALAKLHQDTQIALRARRPSGEFRP